MASLAELYTTLHPLRSEQALAKKVYEQGAQARSKQIETVLASIMAISHGLDADKVNRGKAILAVWGTFEKAGGGRTAALSRAIGDLSLGGGRGLAKAYVGTKSYDRWHGLYIECEYGLAPRHGTVIFSIGLSADARTRMTNGGALTAAEIDDALYLLTNLQSIQKSEAAARAHA